MGFLGTLKGSYFAILEHWKSDAWRELQMVANN